MRKRMIVLGLMSALCTLINATGKNVKSDEINYHHKLVNKEISKSFNTETFELNEMFPADTSGNIRHSNGKFFNVSENISQKGYCYIGRVNSCRAGGCSISRPVGTNEEYEYFDYVVIFDSSLAVKGIRVFNYHATYGQEICSRNWLKQFIGFKGNTQLNVGKDIDAISGATISVYAITLEIERVSLTLRENFNLCAK